MKHTAIQAAKVFGLLVAFYLTLGLVAYLVPDWMVREHVHKTVYIGDLLNDYPKAILLEDLNQQDSYTLDGFTDGLIVNQALMLRSEGLKGVLLLPRYQQDKDNQSSSLGALLAVPPEKGGWTPRMSQRDDSGKVVYYGRYWHGSTFVTRLLLSVMTFIGIRWLLYVVSTILLLWCCVKLWYSVGRAVAVAIPFSLLMVNVYVMQFSMQFAPVLIIALATILWMAYHPTMSVWQCGLLLFIAGSLTAYFDLITVPTLSLGLPLVVWIATQRNQDWRQGLWSVVSLALWWLVGYVLTWLAKWGLATLLTDENIFADAYCEADKWSSGGGSYIGDALTFCLGRVRWVCVAIPAVLLLVLAILRPRNGWSQVAQYLLVMLIPFVYYLLMAHPAAHHSWFNYRALATAVAALLMALASMVDWNHLRIIKKRK